MRIQRVLILLVVALFTASALAQGAAGARPQQPREGGRRGGMGMGMGGMMMLAPELQKELKITAAQKASIEKIMKEMQAQPRNGGNNREAFQKYQTRIMNVLSASQKARLNQIQLQMRGGSAFLDPTVQKQLGITAAQKTKLTSLREASQKEMRAKFESARKANKPMDPAVMQKMRAAQDAKYMAVLSAAQKAKWKTMTGKPFAMPAMRARRAGL
jgi:Spy/CpxP family protein refolding chaperone